MFELFEFAGQRNLANRVRYGRAYPGVLRQVALRADQFIKTFRHVSDARSGPVIRFYAIEVLFLKREKLGEARQSIRDFRVAQDRIAGVHSDP